MSEGSAAPKESSIRRPILFGIIPLCLLLGSLFAAYVLLDPWQWWRNRSRYEEILRRIEAAGILPGQERVFLISVEKNPETLRPAGEVRTWNNYDVLVNGQVIEARRHPNGRLVVRFRLPGRRPNRGLFYSSGEPDESELRNSCGPYTETHKLADHWWAGEDRSD